MDKGKESGINYEYGCIKAFVETTDCQELRDKYGFNPQVLANIMNLLKTLAWKMKLLLMITIHMLKPLKVLFLISMLIFVECIDLVKILIMKKNIVNFISMKKIERGIGL